MTKLSNLTVKGQVTIPKNVRDALGLAAGDQVEFDWNDRGEAVIRKAIVDREEKLAEIYRGFARAREIMRPYAWNMSTDEIMKELRGDEPLPP